MEISVVQRLEQIADTYGAELEVLEQKDGSFIDCVLQKDDVDLDIIVPKHGGEYVAYGIESTGLPREIYPDNVRRGFAEQARSDEILETTEKILAKELVFHRKPGIFNRNAGYVLMPIDGEQHKIPQRRNFFNLPVAQ